MSERHTLKSGGWIDVRPADRITERQRRKARLLIQRLTPAAKAAMNGNVTVEETAAAMTPADAEAMYELNDLVAAETIEAWSFGDTVSTELLVDLPGDAYDEILTITAPAVGAFFGVDFSPTPDLATPTEPSDG